MSWGPFTLPDGRTVRPHPRDPRDGTIGSDRYQVAWNGDEVTVTDEGGLVVFNGKPRRARTKPAGQKSNAPTVTNSAATNAARTRFVQHTEFLQEVARHLEPIENMTWVHMWDRAIGDRVEVAVKTLATLQGVNERTVRRAVRVLTDVGLLDRLVRGTRQQGCSVYRLNLSPKVCAAAAASLAASRQPATARQTSPRAKHGSRNELGHFSTGRTRPVEPVHNRTGVSA